MAPGPAAASLAVRIDGIANAEIIEAGPRSRAPMIPVSMSLRP
jgi:hypothetical protein